jgi:hypothetical protein
MPSSGAQKWFNRQSKEEQERILASAPSIDAWFDNVVKAGGANPDGTPRQGMKGAKSREMEGEGHSGWSQQGGYGAIPSDTTGMRDWARKHGMSEDYDRFDEATLNLWAKQRDPNCPPKFPYQSYNGTGCAEKPIDSGLNAPEGPGPRGGGGRGGRGRRPGPPPPPPKPVTFGKQLSYTGNPMQDMLIQQFNMRVNPMDPSQANIFGMGMDRAIGGEGAAADKPQMAQTLAGGGLWRGANETFGGFRADQSNVAKPKKQGRGRRRRRSGAFPAAPQAPDPQAIAAPPGAAPSPTPAPPIPEFKSGIGGMMGRRYGERTSLF